MPSIHKKSFAAEQLARQKKKSPVIWAIVGVGVVALLIGGYLFYQRSLSQKQAGTAAHEIESIAVLPFVNMSADPEQEYFCDGLADDIILALTNVRTLHVLARTSSFAFKGQDKDIRDIGRDLKVDAVFEGSVSKSGTRLRINAQLINVATGYHILSEQYNYEMADVLDIRDDISMKIVEKLKIELGEKEKATIEKRHTENIEAYELYLKGRYFWYSRQEGSVQNAIKCFRQAIEKDSLYTLPYIGIGDSYGVMGFYGYMPPNEAWPIDRVWLNKALEIDDSIGETHASLGAVSLFYEWDFPAAESEFKKAFELNKDYLMAHMWYSLLLTSTERLDEGIAAAKRAQELDPLSLMINSVLGGIHYQARRYDDAIEQLRKTLELDPNHVVALENMGVAYTGKEMWEEAIVTFNKLLSISGNSQSAIGYLGMAYAISGQEDEAFKMLDRLKELSEERYVSPYNSAVIYIGLSDKDQAFEYLEKACEEREGQLTYIKVWPLFDSLRSDPRFKALLKNMNFPAE